MPITRIALVGHCGFDSGSLSRFAKEIAPDAEVVRINDQAALDEASDPQTLLLVNRVLDGRFDIGGSGIELIREFAARAEAAPTMLISNFEQSQQEAEAAGALPGFGKSQVDDITIRKRIADSIADHEA